MKIKISIFLMCISILMVLVIPINRVGAEQRACELPGAAVPCASYQPDYDSSTLKNILQSIWNWFIIIAAAICIIVIIWAGITYATAGGDEEKVGKAKSRLIYGIIGVAVIVAAYAITGFIGTTLGGGGEIPTPDL